MREFLRIYQVQVGLAIQSIFYVHRLAMINEMQIANLSHTVLTSPKYCSVLGNLNNFRSYLWQKNYISLLTDISSVL